MARFLCFAILAALLALSTTIRAEARSYALLVGVSDYDDTIGLADLRGPANDIALLSEVLSARRDFDIRILADGINGATRPTRAAILAAFDALEQEARPGDFIYVHMSGHGTQQADRNGDESDGVDEVFLPADTARAAPGTGVIPNAIVDEELGARITALRRKGADVWFVLDSCHSGSGLRAASPRSAARFVDPAVLGVSLTATGPAHGATALDAVAQELPGKYLAFYAAQSSEVAREVQIDSAAPDSWYGLFSAKLAARLQSDQGQSYRQLFQAVLADMSDSALPGSARLQTPLWEGDLIDAPVFGGGDTVGIRQFAVDGSRLLAGKLHGLRDNTVVALVEDAAAPAQDILGFAQLELTKARSAALARVGGDCQASVETACARLGPLSGKARFARVVSKPREMALRITPPSDLATGQPVPADHPMVQALVKAIAAVNASEGTRIRLDPDGQVLSGVAEGALWFGPRVSAGASPIGLRWAAPDPLEPLLLRIARAEEIAATFASVAGTPSLLFPSPVDIKVQRLTSDPTRLSATAPQDLRGECRAALASGALSDQLPAGEPLKQCDHIVFGGQGTVQGPARDVNRIYIDSQYCVAARYQRVEGTRTPAILGDPITICSDCPDGATLTAKAGVERLFMVISEAEDNREALNLEGVLDNCAPTPSGTRSGAGAQLSDLLQTLGASDPTRGGMGGIGIASIWVEPFTWQVLPRHEALARQSRASTQAGD